MAKTWLWDTKKSEEEAKHILNDPSHKSFVFYAALLLSRSNVPKDVFQNYLSKKRFCQFWQKIKRRMRKDKWTESRIMFWEEIYRFLIKDFRAKGISFPREVPKRKINPLQQKIAQKIKFARCAQKMTQKELAKKMGVAQQFVSRTESGRENLSLRTIQRISDCLKIDFNMLESGFL